MPPPTTGLEVSSVGLGAWSWGDRSGYWGGWDKADNKKVGAVSARC